MNSLSPTNKRTFHLNYEYFGGKKQQELKRIASEGKHFKNTSLLKDDQYYMNRIIALKAENDLAYNDSRRRDISHIDEQIYRELNFIRDQVETVKNELKLCDSGSSIRNRSNNPSVISSKTLDNMQSKLSRVYTNNTTSLANQREQNKTPDPPLISLSPKNQAESKISNSFVKWKNQRPPIKKQPFAPPPQIQTPQQRQSNYLFCLFSRLSNSSVITLIDRNKIRVKQEDKCGNQQSFKTYTFKNPLLTTINDIEQFYNKNKFSENFMIIGGKSTTKKKIVEQLIRSMIIGLSSNVISMKIKFAIHGSIAKSEILAQLPFSITQQEVQLYECECNLESPENIFNQLHQLMQQQASDTYHQIKQFFHSQVSITQNLQLKKTLMSLVNKDINCIRGYSIELQTYTEKLSYNIITTNYIITNHLKVLSDSSQSLLQQGEGHSFILNCLEKMNNDETIRVFCINPLRYRIKDSLNLLQMMTN